MDQLQTTDATTDSTALTTVGADALDAAAGATPGADDGANSDALAITELSAEGDLSALLESIPADDKDIEAQSTAPMYQDVVRQRGELRTLAEVIRELQPLTAYRDFGKPDYVQGRLEALDALFSPVLDENNQPLRDPKTQTTFYSTAPGLLAIEKGSPGFCEQAFADLCAMQFPNGSGALETLGSQYLRYLKLDPIRLTDYRNIDKLLTAADINVDVEELVDIPTDYHAAYRTILPEVRAQWSKYSEAGRAQLLQQAKRELDRIDSDKAKALEESKRDAYELAQYHGLVREEQGKFLDTFRRENFTKIDASLSKQIKFSDDPIRNTVMQGAVGAVLANIIDPEFNFISIEKTLKALNIVLPTEFFQNLELFNVNANEYVALKLADETDRSLAALEKAQNAAGRVLAKLATIQIAVAKAMGGTVLEQAIKTGTAVQAAATGRESIGAGGGDTAQQATPPTGIVPGSPEWQKFYANLYIQQQRNVAAA